MPSAPEGLRVLETLEQAPHYNAWLSSRFRQHLGRRVLEVGAGIGTITALIHEGRELVVALEADPVHSERLRTRFRDIPTVEPLHAAVEDTDWDALAARGFDSVLMSNVLEHIPDDGAALRNLHRVLAPHGRIILFVPALPALFGTMDEAVGHCRRYTREGLSGVLTQSGFQVETLEWMNLVGIPGWFLNGRILKRPAPPVGQVRLYDTVAPLLARLESRFTPPIGMSLFAVARAAGQPSEHAP